MSRYIEQLKFVPFCYFYKKIHFGILSCVITGHQYDPEMKDKTKCSVEPMPKNNLNQGSKQCCKLYWYYKNCSLWIHTNWVHSEPGLLCGGAEEATWMSYMKTTWTFRQQHIYFVSWQSIYSDNTVYEGVLSGKTNQMLVHPPYSPDSAQYDFSYFPYLQKHYEGCILITLVTPRAIKIQW